MFEQELKLFHEEGIEIDDKVFPWEYYDRYLIICNPVLKGHHEEIVHKMQYLKSHVDADTYETTIIFGAIVNLSKAQTYNFIVALRHKSFCDFVNNIQHKFEVHKNEVESFLGVHCD